MDSEDNFGNTKENLQMAIDGESYENLTMYPDFAQVAKDEGHKEAAWICEVCGHVHYGKKALKVCPVCKHGQEYQSRLNSKK